MAQSVRRPGSCTAEITVSRASVLVKFVVFLVILLVSGVLSMQAPAQVGLGVPTPISGWLQLSPAHSPGARFGQAMAYDKAHKQIVLFGGSYQTGYGGDPGYANGPGALVAANLADTWTWNGTDWTQLSPANAPPTRTFAMMAYDEVHQQVVLFSGLGAGADTWIWDGTTWTQAISQNAPFARHNASMVWDPALQRIVLFGGYGNDANENLNDLWTWDGTNWTNVAASTPVPARGDFGMVYDAAHKYLLIFGGVQMKSGSFPLAQLSNGVLYTALQDTWSWDGTNWTQLASMNYDIPQAYGTIGAVPGNPNAIYGIVGWGGYDAAGWTGYNINLLWNGQSWNTVAVFNSPTPRYDPNGMVYDDDSGQLLLFGGLSPPLTGYQFFGDTWVYQKPQADFGNVQVCAPGATDPTCSKTATIILAETNRDYGVANQAFNDSDFTLEFGNWDCPASADNPIQPNQNGIGDAVASLQYYCWATVTFTPTRPGLRSAALDGVPLETSFFLHGTGIAPQGLFLNPQVQAAGGALAGPTATAGDDAGNLWVADSVTGTVTAAPNSDPNCTQASDCAVIATGLNGPSDITMDGGGDILIADTGNNKVELVLDPRNFNMYPVTQSHQQDLFDGLNAPRGLAMDTWGSVFISQGNQTVIEEPWNGGGWNPAITVLNTSNTNLAFDPRQVAAGPNGNVFVADSGNGQILELSWTAAGWSSPVAVVSGLNHPEAVTVDAMGNLFYFDRDQDKILRLPWNGSSFGTAQTVLDSTVAGTGFSADRLSADPAGDVYYVDVNAHAARKLSFASPALNFATTPDGSTSSDSPKYATLLSYGNQPLTLSIPSAGTNPSISKYFSFGSGSCPVLTASSFATQSLNPGDSCYMPVSFMPTAGGHIEGSVVVSDNGLNQTNGTQTLELFGESADTPDHLQMQAPATAFPGGVFNLTVSVADVNGNAMTSYTGTVHFTSTDSSATLPSNYTFTGTDAGVHVFPVTLNGLGPQTVTATDISEITSTDTGTIPIEGTASILVHQAPVFTSSNTLTVYAGINNHVLVTTQAYPIAHLSLSGSLPQGMSFTDNGDGTATIAGITYDGSIGLPPPAGPYPVTVTATNGVAPDGIQNLTVQLVNNPNYVVNSAADDSSGNAANCPQNGGAATCTLRDALAASAAIGGVITFSATVFNAPTTIQLTGGELSIPGGTVIVGATTGSGLSLTNLVTIDAQGASRIFSFSPASTASTGEVDDLAMINGSASSSGGGAILVSNGTFTVRNCFFSANKTSGSGGAMEVAAVAWIIGSTFANNQATGNGGAVDMTNGGGLLWDDTFYGNSARVGGAINALGVAEVLSSTIVNNSAHVAGGGISNAPIQIATYPGNLQSYLTTYNDVVVNNTAPDGTDNLYVLNELYDNPPTFLYLVYMDLGSSVIGDNFASGYNFNLSQPGSYGGPTPTILPLPGSIAICYSPGVYSGPNNDLPYNTDQRGLPIVNLIYSQQQGLGCTDAGAVQTNYGLTFSAQPAAIAPQTVILPSTSFNAAVTLTESGQPVSLDGAALPLTFTGTGTLSGGSGSTIAGVASYNTLQVDTPGTGDTLTASLGLNGSSTANPTVFATSSPFAVAQGQPTVSFAPSPASQTYGDALAAGSLNAVATFNNVILPGTFSYSTFLYGRVQALTPGITTLPAGTYSVLATFIPDDSVRYLPATASATYQVNKATGSVMLGNLSQTYTGVPLSASATTNPSGLAVVLAYNGSAAPAAAGTYTVVGTIQDANYQGSATGTMVIGKANAPVMLGGLSQTYTGSPLSATATTVPSGLAAVFTYNGSSTPPTTVGSYNVVATINDANYQGSAAGMLVIGKATPPVSWTPPVAITYGTALTSAQLNASSSTPGGFVYSPAAGTVLQVGSQTLMVQFTPTDGTDYLNASASVPITVDRATLTLTANDTTRVYGTANPTFTGAVTGQQNGDAFSESFMTAATLSSPAGAYSIVPSVSGANLADYTQAVTDGALTIAQAASTIAVRASSTSITPGQSVTLTATVTPATTGTPTGTVSFYDNGALLNATPATLSAGVAGFATTALAPGITHTITATYSGDVNFTAANNAAAPPAIAVAPLDFVMTLAGPPSLTVLPGQSISSQIQVTPDYGTYAGPVSFTTTGLPAGATATFSPATIAANGGPQTITVSIQTASLTAARQRTGARHGLPIAAAGMLFLGLGLFRRRGKAMPRLLAAVVLMLGATLGLSGCGAATGFFGTAPQSYTVTVTATSGPLTHTTNITLNVQ